jgi:hypothetical protein
MPFFKLVKRDVGKSPRSGEHFAPAGHSVLPFGMLNDVVVAIFLHMWQITITLQDAAATLPAGVTSTVATVETDVPATSVTGRVFVDWNDNGRYDAGEETLDSVDVCLSPHFALMPIQFCK